MKGGGPLAALRALVLKDLEADLRLAAPKSAWATDLGILKELTEESLAVGADRVVLVIARHRRIQ